MATTSGRLALAAVDAVARSGVGFCVLHKEEELAAGHVTSDVDLVVDRPVDEVVAAVTERWRHAGLFPVVVWPYDVGGTGSVFLADATAADGVQIDLLHDPQGAGRYGVLSRRVLQAVRPGSRFPVAGPEAATAYEVVKRIQKGQPELARALIQEHGSAEVADAARGFLRADMANAVATFTAGGEATARRGRPSIARLVRRLRHPVGAWVALTNAGLGPTLASRFGRFLPTAVFAGSVSTASWLPSVAPVRWRPGLVFTEDGGSRPWPFRPDLVVEAGSVEEACGLVVSHLAGRHR